MTICGVKQCLMNLAWRTLCSLPHTGDNASWTPLYQLKLFYFVSCFGDHVFMAAFLNTFWLKVQLWLLHHLMYLRTALLWFIECRIINPPNW